MRPTCRPELPPKQIFYGEDHPMWGWPGWKKRRCSDRETAFGNPLAGKCQMCGQAPLRFVHQFEHPDFVPEIGGNAWVELGGCTCTQRLCPDYDTDEEEKWAKGRKDR